MNLYQNAQAYVENSDRLFEGSLEKVEGELYISDVKILRVWQNMLSNAVKYSAPYSTVTIRIALENGKFLFQVSDQGRESAKRSRSISLICFIKVIRPRRRATALDFMCQNRFWKPMVPGCVFIPFRERAAHSGLNFRPEAELFKLCLKHIADAPD